MRIFKRILILISMIIAMVAMALPLSAAAFAQTAVKQVCDVDKCADLSGVVSMQEHFTRTFDWTISKKVNPDFWDLPAGGSAASNYTISVNTTGHTDKAWFTGNICVTNEGLVATQGLLVTANFENSTNIVSNFVVSSGVEIPAASSLCFPYTFNVPDPLIVGGAPFSVHAHISASNASSARAEGEANLDVLPDLINNTVTVTDSFNNATLGTVASTDVLPKSFTYNRTFTCGSTQTYANTAQVIGDNGQSLAEASASVRVICEEPGVTPTATEPPTTTTTTTTTFTPGLPNTGSDPNS